PCLKYEDGRWGKKVAWGGRAQSDRTRNNGRDAGRGEAAPRQSGAGDRRQPGNRESHCGKAGVARRGVGDLRTRGSGASAERKGNRRRGGERSSPGVEGGCDTREGHR